MAGIRVREVFSLSYLCFSDKKKNSVFQQLLCAHYCVSARSHCICYPTQLGDSISPLSGKAFPGVILSHLVYDSMWVRRSHFRRAPLCMYALSWYLYPFHSGPMELTSSYLYRDWNSFHVSVLLVIVVCPISSSQSNLTSLFPALHRAPLSLVGKVFSQVSPLSV